MTCAVPEGERYRAPARAEVGATALPEAIRLEATTDPNDRAHVEGGSTARYYPSCYMVGQEGRRVSFETSMEDAAELEAMLGFQRPRQAAAQDYALALLESKNDVRLRDILRGKTRQKGGERCGG